MTLVLKASRAVGLSLMINQENINSEISLSELFRLIRKRLTRILAFTAIVTTLVSIYTLFQPKIYRAEAKLLTAENATSSSILSVLGQAFSPTSSLKSQQQRLETLLSSRTFAERVVRRFDLMRKLFSDLWNDKEGQWHVKNPSQIPKVEDAASLLSGMMDVTNNMDGTLGLAVEGTDPKLVSDLVNQIVDELDHFIDDHELIKEKRNRLFVGQQLMSYRREYFVISKSLTKYYEHVSPSTPKVDVEISIDPPLLENEQLPKYNYVNHAALSQEILAVEEKKKEIDKKLKDSIVEDIPQHIHMEYLALQRNIVGELIRMLSQNYELALIEENRQEFSFLVLDEARPPTDIYKPRLKRIIYFTFIAAFIIAVFVSVLVEYLQIDVRRNP